MAVKLEGFVDDGKGSPLPNISAIVTRVADGAIVTSGLTGADGRWVFTGLSEGDEHFVNLADGAGNAIVRGPWSGELREAWVRDRLALPDTGLAVLPNGGNTTVGGLPLVLDPNPINVLEWTATGIFSAGAVGLTEEAADLRYVNLDGDTMTGDLTIGGAAGLTINGSGSLYVGGPSTFEGDVTLFRGLVVALGIEAAGPVVVDDTLSVASKPVIVSPTAGNTLTWDATGLYSAGGMTQAAADLRYEPIDTMYTKAESDARYPQKTDIDPYPQYLTATEGDALFLTQTEGDARYEPFDSAYTKGESDSLFVNTAGDLMTGTLMIWGAGAPTLTAFQVGTTGNAVASLNIQKGGTVEWSNGTLAADTTLARTAVGVLSVTGKPLVVSPTGGNVLTWDATGLYAPAGGGGGVDLATGNATWVNVVGDTMTGDLNMTANVLPTVTNVRSLGSTSLRWLKVWAQDADFTNAPTVGGAALLTSTTADALFLTPAEGNAAYATAAHNHDTTYVQLTGGSVMTGLLGPTTTNTRDLGTTALRWRKLWAVDGEFTNAPTVGGVALLTATAADALFLTPAEGNAAYSPIGALTQAAADTRYVNTTSDTMTGFLNIDSDGTQMTIRASGGFTASIIGQASRGTLATPVDSNANDWIRWDQGQARIAGAWQTVSYELFQVGAIAAGKGTGKWTIALANTAGTTVDRLSLDGSAGAATLTGTLAVSGAASAGGLLTASAGLAVTGAATVSTTLSVNSRPVIMAGVRVYHSVDQAIINATSVLLAFNSERYDTDGFHDNVTNNSRLTVPAGLGGKYLIHATVAWSFNADSNMRAIQLRVNGTTYIALETGPALAIGSQPTRQTISTVWDMAAGDYVEIQPYQASGVTLNITANGAYSAEFGMQRIG